MSFSGQLYGQQIIEELTNPGNIEAVGFCIEGLRRTGNAQRYLSERNPERAIQEGLVAEQNFNKVPKAKLLLGLVKNEIAAAYGYLKEYSKSVDYAEEALSIIGINEDLIKTRASTHFNCGASHDRLNNYKKAKEHFMKAKRLFQGIPGSEMQLMIIDQKLSTLQ